MELKARVDGLAAELGISQSAVWKILLRRTVMPLLEENGLNALDAFPDSSATKSIPVRDSSRPVEKTGRDSEVAHPRQ